MMHVEMIDPQRLLLADIADPHMTRDDVALTYAFAIRQSACVDWTVVNDAIIERWSLSALQYIKTTAWRKVEDGRTVTRDRIAPSLNATYGKSPMVDMLADYLAGKIDTGDYDERGREYMIASVCWGWGGGRGGAAANVAAEIEAILQLPSSEDGQQ